MSAISRLLLGLLLLGSAVPGSAENKLKSFEAAQKLASDRADVFSGGPIEIRAEVELIGQARPTHGTYRYVYSSPEEWRQEFSFPDYQQIIIFKSGTYHVTRSRNFEPLTLFYARELIGIIQAKLLLRQTAETFTAGENGAESKCYRIQDSYGYGGVAVCFDAATGMLAVFERNENWEYHRMEYSGFMAVRDKLFPRRMRRLRNGEVMIEVNIQSISRATLNADLFQVPATALKYQSCKKFQRASNEYGPDYFQIRSDSTGSVVLAGTLDEYGKVVEVEIQQSAGEKSDRLVRQALKEMRFSPAKCDGRRITSFFRFQMWFSRSLHPDSFHSFQW